MTAAGTTNYLPTHNATTAPPKWYNPAYCRAYQSVMRKAAHFMHWRTPKVLSDYSELRDELRAHDINSVLVVSDPGLVKAGLVGALEDSLRAAGFTVSTYAETAPGPTTEDVARGLSIYYNNKCTGIVALGGGSAMDCAKGIAARVAQPNKSIAQLRGQLKVRSGVPYLAAIPTTAGTGSETTVAAVITDPETHDKGAINDPALIPQAAVLDPHLTEGVPPKVTAATGIDALSHAVEAYIGQSNTYETRRDALIATRLIFKWLPVAVADGHNLEARAAMQKAAFLAGTAFTRAYVGYVHAASHQLSALYGTVHGVGNGALMPHVLEMFGHAADSQLADLGRAALIPDWDKGTDSEKAQRFIAAVRDLTAEIGLPLTLPEIKPADIPELARKAAKEGNPLYPVPEIWQIPEFEELYRAVSESSGQGVTA
ncbi:MAG: iron-containing alcohol dehydrogenase [Cellulomonadaceae bacterium]|nr:iron-containing alcohol dehydrogenase [Cellulomonadaceae bacterium]